MGMIALEHVDERACEIAGIPLRVVLCGLSRAESSDVDYVLGNFYCAPRPTKHCITVENTGTHYLLACTVPDGYVARITASSLRELLPALDGNLQAFVHGECVDHVIFLGSSVVLNGTAIWLSGVRGSGKTTIALQLLLFHGAEFMSDDLVLWHEGTQTVRPYAKPLRLRADGTHVSGDQRRWGMHLTVAYRPESCWLVNPVADGTAKLAMAADRVVLVHATYRPDLGRGASIEAKDAVECESHLRAAKVRPKAVQAQLLGQMTRHVRFYRLFYAEAEAACQGILESI